MYPLCYLLVLGFFFRTSQKGKPDTSQKPKGFMTMAQMAERGEIYDI